VRSSFPADSATPVSLAHHIVLHGEKLPPIGWALLVMLNEYVHLFARVADLQSKFHYNLQPNHYR